MNVQPPVNINILQNDYNYNRANYKLAKEKTVLLVALFVLSCIHLGFNIRGALGKISAFDLGIVNITYIGVSTILLAAFVSKSIPEHEKEKVQALLGMIVLTIIYFLGYIVTNGLSITGRINLKTIAYLSIGTPISVLSLGALVSSIFQFIEQNENRVRYENSTLALQRAKLANPQGRRDLNQMLGILQAREEIFHRSRTNGNLNEPYQLQLRNFRSEYGEPGIAELILSHNNGKRAELRTITANDL